MTSALHFWHRHARDVDYTFEEEQTWRQLTALFIQSLDLKDSALMRSVIAPKFRNYLSVILPGVPDEVITADELIKEIFSAAFLLDPTLKTQHLLGGVHWIRNDREHAIGVWQLQATEHRSHDDGQQSAWVANTYLTLYYDQVDGVWLVGGIQPQKLITQLGQEQGTLLLSAPSPSGGQTTARVSGILGRPVQTPSTTNGSGPVVNGRQATTPQPQQVFSGIPVPLRSHKTP